MYICTNICKCVIFIQENLLLDENSNIKLIDFGLSAEPQVRMC